jgi:hypothetical protein
MKWVCSLFWHDWTPWQRVPKWVPSVHTQSRVCQRCGARRWK